MSEIVKDELIKPMDRAIWNVEHVIKFSKSKHLRYYGHDISLIDYYATIAILILPLFFIICYACFVLNNLGDKRKRSSFNCTKDRIKFFARSKVE